jgi:HSP20 family protein
MPFLTRWNDDFGWGDFDRTFSLLDEMRRRMDRAFDEVAGGRAPAIGVHASWPRANLYDTGSELMLRAEVPGVSEKDLDLQLNQDVLTLSGERKAEVPEGYSAHRRERGGLKFSRSFTLPFKVDPEKCSANLERGVLTVKIAKAPESQPRQITVKAN